MAKMSEKGHFGPLCRALFFHHLTRLCSSRRPETLLFEFLSPRQISPTFDENVLTLPLRFGSPLDTTLSFILFNYYSIVLLFFFSFLHLIMLIFRSEPHGCLCCRRHQDPFLDADLLLLEIFLFISCSVFLYYVQNPFT